MNEHDQIRAQKLSEARAEAEMSGRADVTEYLTLRAENDLVRQTSVDWLLESLLEIAAEANRRRANIKIETEFDHRFQHNNSGLSGSCVRLSQGVRCLTVEAGWTRQPADGFMRGGAFAAARITHFGMFKHNAELLLAQSNNTLNWFAVGRDGTRELFNAVNLQRHFEIFTG